MIETLFEMFKAKVGHIHIFDLSNIILIQCTSILTFPFTIHQDIIHSADDEELDVLPDAAEKFDELLQRVRAKEHKKRTMGRIQLSLGKDLSLGVGV